MCTKTPFISQPPSLVNDRAYFPPADRVPIELYISYYVCLIYNLTFLGIIFSSLIEHKTFLKIILCYRINMIKPISHLNQKPFLLLYLCLVRTRVRPGRHVSLLTSTIVTRTIALPQSRLNCYYDLNVGE